MPVTIRKKKGCYEVSTPNGVHAKCTSLKNAKAQERLLNAIDHGYVVHRKRKKGGERDEEEGQG